MILGIEASLLNLRRLKDKLFPFLTSYLGTFILKYFDFCIECISVSLANNVVVDRCYVFVQRKESWESKPMKKRVK